MIILQKPFNPIEVLARVRSQLRRYNKLGGSEDSNKKEVLSCGGVTLDDQAQSKSQWTAKKYHSLQLNTKS